MVSKTSLEQAKGQTEESEFEKSVFTTGEAARICNVSQQTIIRCFDREELEGFRVPGSTFRRIPRKALYAFMKKHKIPLPHGWTESDYLAAILVRDEIRTAIEQLSSDIAKRLLQANAFSLGRNLQSMPNVVILDEVIVKDMLLEISQEIRNNMKNSRIAIVGETEAIPDQNYDLKISATRNELIALDIVKFIQESDS